MIIDKLEKMDLPVLTGGSFLFPLSPLPASVRGQIPLPAKIDHK